MIERERAGRIYRTMCRIRAFEFKAVNLFENNKLRGSVHLYIGQEAIAATIGSRLTDADYIASTHRGHGHCIAKGASLDKCMAELMGKETGYCRGRSGSMHIADFKTGKAHDKWATNDSTFKYKIQLYFYKFLLENSREYRNYKVTKGRLDWIAPNDFGETITLELDFKDAEAEQIKHLIKVVFHHIKTLDFPDTSAAEAAYNPTKAFFDQLIAEE